MRAVHRIRAGDEASEQRPHLRVLERLARPHDGMTRERCPDALIRVEPRDLVREIRNVRANVEGARSVARGRRDHAITALSERFDLESGGCQRRTRTFEPIVRLGVEFERVRQEQRLARRAACPGTRGDRFVGDAFVRRVLVDEHERAAVGRQQIRIVELREDA